ncbi:hypothetical protein E2C01_070977 [Portunus trituberculatus]|uniref:Uncharacterized protein n=1 Tax=Portunus trituberculatus TaxID=210409 RepID=A0A5B7HU62_PORTR|nr:hypothetical protein [Portunus trituberculatus]
MRKQHSTPSSLASVMDAACHGAGEGRREEGSPPPTRHTTSTPPASLHRATLRPALYSAKVTLRSQPVVIRTIYGGQKINDHTLHYFNPHIRKFLKLYKITK